jgi:DNA-directed RNA polymerase specialized sigma24 family protein
VSSVEVFLDSPEQVIRGLVRYTDWWQPSSTSVLQVGPARRAKGYTDGIPPGLLGSLDERAELCSRMQQVAARDRLLLFLWYVQQLSVDEIAPIVKISRRQCFRRRAAAIKEIVKLGDPERGEAA